MPETVGDGFGPPLHYVELWNMRITIVHSFYRKSMPSGENQVVLNQSEALSDFGHDVTLVDASTDETDLGFSFNLRSSIRVITGFGPPRTSTIESQKPDVVHVHNTFPNVGWRGLARWQGPIIHTLHNFRPICSAATLFRDGTPCYACLGRIPVAAIRHGCYDGSRLKTIPLAIRNSVPVNRQGLLRRANALIVGSHTGRSIYLAAGVPEHLLRVIPNGVEVVAPQPPSYGSRFGWVVAARLDSAKGVLELIGDWPEYQPLDVYGSGPLEEEVAAACGGRTIFRGSVPLEVLRERLASAKGLIIPSRWLEMNPTIVTEALAQGTPIIALRGNAAAEVIDRFNVGATYSNAETLAQALNDVSDRSFSLQERSRAAYQSEYTCEVWVRRLELLYRELAQS